MNDEPTLELLIRIVGSIKPRRIEGELQAAIAGKLAAHGIAFAREARLDSKSRLDFKIEIGAEVICLETKVTGASSPATERQLLRYAMTKKIDRIILVTTKPIRLRSEAFVIGEKIIPVQIVNIALNSL